MTLRELNFNLPFTTCSGMTADDMSLWVLLTRLCHVMWQGALTPFLTHRNPFEFIANEHLSGFVFLTLLGRK